MPKLLIIFAHPDDETFSTGGTLIKLVRAGVEIHSICATKGEKGQRTGFESDPRPTGEIREEELKKAASIIGIRQLIFLGFMDGELNDVDKHALNQKIATEIEKIKPDVILTFEPHGITAHPDHQVISKVVTDLVTTSHTKWPFLKRLFYAGLPESIATQLNSTGMNGKIMEGTPDSQFDIWSDLTEVVDIKSEAMTAHASQIRDVERVWNNIPELRLQEAFIQAWPSHSKAKKDFFDGL